MASRGADAKVDEDGLFIHVFREQAMPPVVLPTVEDRMFLIAHDFTEDPTEKMSFRTVWFRKIENQELMDLGRRDDALPACVVHVPLLRTTAPGEHPERPESAADLMLRLSTTYEDHTRCFALERHPPHSLRALQTHGAEYGGFVRVPLTTPQVEWVYEQTSPDQLDEDLVNTMVRQTSVEEVHSSAWILAAQRTLFACIRASSFALEAFERLTRDPNKVPLITTPPLYTPQVSAVNVDTVQSLRAERLDIFAAIAGRHVACEDSEEEED